MRNSDKSPAAVTLAWVGDIRRSEVGIQTSIPSTFSWTRRSLNEFSAGSFARASVLLESAIDGDSSVVTQLRLVKVLKILRRNIIKVKNVH